MPLRFYGPSVEWLAFIDVDEFIVPLVDDDIPTLLARWPEAADVRVPRVDFGFSGQRDAARGADHRGLHRGRRRLRSRPGQAAAGEDDRCGRAPSRRWASTPRPWPTARSTPTAGPCPTRPSGRPATPSCSSTTTTRAPSRSSRPSASGAAPPVASPARPSRSTCPRCARTAARIASWRARRPPSSTCAAWRRARTTTAASSPWSSSRTSTTSGSSPSSPSPTSSWASPSRGASRACGSTTATRARASWPISPVSGTCPRTGDLSRSVHLGPLLERARGRLEASWARHPDEVAASLRGGSRDGRGRRAGASSGRRRRWRDVLRHRGGRRAALLRGRASCCARRGPVDAGARAASPPTGAPAHTTEVPLEAAGTYAGVVELDARPAARQRRSSSACARRRRVPRPRPLRAVLWLSGPPSGAPPGGVT